MKSKLEQRLYDSSRISSDDNNYFVAGDLENLSAEPLYSCSITVTPGSVGGGSSGSGNYSSGSGPISKKSFGSAPLEIPKLDFTLPKVGSGPINIGGSKPMSSISNFAKEYLDNSYEFPKPVNVPTLPYEIPKVGSKPLGSKIDVPERIKKYLDGETLPKVGSKPLDFSKHFEFQKKETPKFPYELPKVSSKPLYEVPEIDIQDYLDRINAREVGSRPLDPRVDFSEKIQEHLDKWMLPKVSSKPLYLEPNPIGTFSNFKTGSYNNIFEDIDLGSFFPNDSDAGKLKFQERYDFSMRHGDEPHLNLGLTKKKGYFPFGDAHRINLFDED